MADYGKFWPSFEHFIDTLENIISFVILISLSMFMQAVYQWFIN